MDQLTSQKRSLRETLKQKRAALSQKDQHTAASLLSKHALPFLSSEQQKTISIYSAKGSELDPQHLAEHLARSDHLLCLPVVEPNSKIMTFREYQLGDPLSNGAYDILEPSHQSASVLPQIIFCPLLAVDLSGNRLGYGGGYFDQTLAALRKKTEVMAVGLCYDMQIIEEVPVDENDIKLDYVVSEKRCVQCQVYE